MANFLITTAGTTSEGTSTADLFSLNTALTTTVFGAAGGDTISAAGALNATNARLNAGLGADTISLTAGVPTLTVAQVFAGGDNDLVAIDGAVAANSTINGGGGADTLQISAGVYATTTINSNGGHDFVTASALQGSAAFLGFGGGNDTVNLFSASLNSSTIALGGGADTFSASINSAVGLRIEGDTVGDTVFFGNDSLRIAGNDLGESALVQGGGGADLVAISATLGITSTINGNAGHDSIVLSAIGNGASGSFLGGGAGNDTITISAALVSASATINGGGGDDVLAFSAALATTGAINEIIGGAGSDTIGLGGITSGGTLRVSYAALSESNISAFDNVSANAGANATFTLSQSAVNFASGQLLTNADFSTNTGGVVTFISAVGNNMTARAEMIDRNLGQGQTVIFANAAGTNFLFTQAGAQASGTEGDLIVQLNNTYSAGGTATSGGLVGGGNNSAYTVQIG